MRPSCGQALLRDVQLGHDLEARGQRVLQLHGQGHDVVEDPVDSEPDAELLLVGLDVDVGGPALQGVDEQDVRELDDGRRLRGLGENAQVDLVLGLRHRLHVRLVLGDGVDVHLGQPHGGHVVEGEGRPIHHVLEGGGVPELQAARSHGAAAHPHAPEVALELEGPAGAVVPFDRLLQGGLRGHHGLHVVARHELDVVHGEHVGGVRHGDREGGSRAGERQDLVLPRGLRGDDLDDGRVDLEVLEVDGRDTILAGQEAGDLLVPDVTQGDERLSELAPVHLLVGKGLLELLRGDHVLLQQQLTELDGHI